MKQHRDFKFDWIETIRRLAATKYNEFIRLKIMMETFKKTLQSL